MPTDELCFMHVPKTAGLSWIEMLLASFGTYDVVTRGVNRKTYRPHSRPSLLITVIGHERRGLGVLTLQSYLQATRRRCFVVAFVRNPYDRLVSSFHYLTGGGRTEADQADAQEYVAKYRGDFDAFVRDSLKEQNPRVFSQIHFRPQYQWLVDASGKLSIDCLGRFETLAADTARLEEKWAFRATAIPRLNSSDHKPYSCYYNEATRDLVAQAYREDFEMFGYDPNALTVAAP